MDKRSAENYQVEDFIADESFINYHFKSNNADRLFWEKWVTAHTAKRHLVNEARDMLDTLSLSMSDKEYREELDKISAAIRANQPPAIVRLTGKLPEYKRRRRALQYFLPLLFLLAIAGYWFFKSSQHSEKLTETVNRGSAPLVLTLSDSTIVSLEPHSMLRYPLHFHENERIVYLQGNARFNVTRSAQHPFKVHAENIVATVLGTVFSIKKSGDSSIEVHLLKGKLNVEIMNERMEPAQSVLLDPNEKAIYERNGGRLYKDPIIPENAVYFHKNSFKEIAAKIKDVFGITLINQSNNVMWRFTGEFTNSTAREIIENICLVKKLSFVEKGDTIVIK